MGVYVQTKKRAMSWECFLICFASVQHVIAMATGTTISCSLGRQSLRARAQSISLRCLWLVLIKMLKLTFQETVSKLRPNVESFNVNLSW